MIVFSHVLVLILTLHNVKGFLKTIDLTYVYDETTVVWPTGRKYKFKLDDAGSGGIYKAYRFCTAEHAGTHMDAPIHFAPGKNANAEVPLERLIGNLFVVDVSKMATNNSDLLVSIDHLKMAEQMQKTTMDDKIVLIYTGYSHFYPNLDDYLGTSSTNVSLLHFPGLHPDAASWIVANRKIKSIGIDTASIDYGQSSDYQSHQILSNANIPGFENVDLRDIEKFRYKHDTMIYALPMKIGGGSGGPLRIVAVYDFPDKKSSDTCNSISSHRSVLFSLLIMIIMRQFFL